MNQQTARTNPWRGATRTCHLHWPHLAGQQVWSMQVKTMALWSQTQASTDDPGQQRQMINEVSKISNAKISDRILLSENPKATWKDYDMMYRSSRDAMGAQSTLMGMVNTSTKVQLVQLGASRIWMFLLKCRTWTRKYSPNFELFKRWSLAAPLGLTRPVPWWTVSMLVKTQGMHKKQ